MCAAVVGNMAVMQGEAEHFLLGIQAEGLRQPGVAV